MSTNLLGIDIGGTKCAVIYGIDHDGQIEIADKVRFDTTDVDTTLSTILQELKGLCAKHGLNASNTQGVGISCGGPLDSRRGVVMSPPNLPGWDNIPIVQLVQDACGIPAVLQNDANACAVAEWKYGAGRGTRNMVFLTFGTGLGAGLVLDGKLYSGTNDNAGELGHIRLSEFGPVGYGKAGSVEGFASGGGIAQLAASAVKEKLMMGGKVAWCPDGDLAGISARTVAEAAKTGDELAKSVYRTSATYLGKALALVIDLLNPEVIVIGSIFVRAEELIRPFMQAAIERDALPGAAAVCQVKAAQLGESIGDIAALSLAATLE
ncbi:MAG: ROK family protein [Bacteroidales bacterium]|nr:ROK family protein [Bacteroidales bacterium]